MPLESPKIDPRTATRVEADLLRELHYLRRMNYAWRFFEPSFGLSGAMIGIFSRLAEIVIRRLNDVPRKNMLAFLDMIGASLLPPQPARVPLTFTLAAGGTADAVVPAGTQVAAAPAEGEKTPVIYETERELVVTAAQLDSAFARQPEHDRYADLGRLLGGSVPSGSPVFAGDRRIEHILYIGHDEYFALPSIEEVRLSFTLTWGGTDPRAFQWEVWDGARFIAVNAKGNTNALTNDGDVILADPILTANSPFPRTEVGGVLSRWLRCRLLTPITTSPTPVSNMVRESQLPTVSSVRASVTVSSNKLGLPPDAAFANDLPLDTTKDFMPFGPSPVYNDTFYVANREALSKPGASVTLTFTSTDWVAAGIPQPTASNTLKLRWEYWNGSKWAELATVSNKGEPTKGGVPLAADKFADNTAALTASQGTVVFLLPDDAAATAVNGVENAWVRARIVAGNYGVPPGYAPVTDNNKVITGYKPVAGTLAPPSLSSVAVDFKLVTDSEPAHVVAYNDFHYVAAGPLTFNPFRPTLDKEPALYLGFGLPASRAEFPNRKLSLYAESVVFKPGERYGDIWPPVSRKSGGPGSVVTHEFWLGVRGEPGAIYQFDSYGSSWGQETRQTPRLNAATPKRVTVAVKIPEDAVTGVADRGFVRLVKADDAAVEYGASFETVVSQEWAGRRAQLSWEYWNGAGWAGLVARDGTRNFTTPGLIEFIAPGDFAPREEFGLLRYWLRVRWKSGGFSFAPHLSRLLLNTMTATQAVTVSDELLGSSDASAGQKFRATRAPVLPGERLEVREREAPSDAEAQKVRREEGDDAVTVLKDAAGHVKEVWVRWHGVPDFYSSGPRDRHYVLDRLTGEVRFGDGLNGLIPPALAGNLRLRRYQTGGGVSGNRPAGVVTQLKTTVPYIDKVTNFVPASGGADAEDLSSLIDRAPRTLRHGNRAVAAEDYEDLARLATPEVARVKCVPLFDLTTDPDATRERLGVVSLVVVPRTSEAKPVPSIELLDRVREYLDGHRSPNAELYVVAPDYVRVEIDVTLGVGSLEGAREVESAVSRALSQFLHPLTGGFDGKGWDFGRSVQKSDLYALLEETAGVDHVIALKYAQVVERGKGASTDRALVYSGAHRISLTLEEA